MTRPLALAATWVAALVVPYAAAQPANPAVELGKRFTNVAVPVNDRMSALNRLKNLGSAAAPGYGYLITALDDKNEKIRTAADDALAELDPDFRKAVRSLKYDRDGRANYAAAIQLAKLGTAGKAAVPVLTAHLKATAAAAHKVDKFAEEWLVADAKAESYVPVVAACMAAGGMNQTATENLTPAERRAWGTVNRNGQAVANVLATAVALVKLAPNDAKTLKAVADATLGNGNNMARFAGLVALMLADPVAGRANLPAVRRLKTDPDKSVRDLAGALTKKLEDGK